MAATHKAQRNYKGPDSREWGGGAVRLCPLLVPLSARLKAPYTLGWLSLRVVRGFPSVLYSSRVE